MTCEFCVDYGASTDQRRKKLKKYFQFNCFCERCTCLQLGQVAGKPVTKKLAMVMVQTSSLMAAMEEMAMGKERDYLHSLRLESLY